MEPSQRSLQAQLDQTALHQHKCHSTHQRSSAASDLWLRETGRSQPVRRGFFAQLRCDALIPVRISEKLAREGAVYVHV